MIKINLLPHREMRRERRKKDFVGFGMFVGIVAAGIAFLGITFVAGMISDQNARNEFIKAKNTELDGQIKEIAELQSEIDALKARQLAVENLQSDRTLPVHLLDELVKRVPEGIQLKSIKQEELKVTLVGIAQSNDRVSELLRQLAYQTPWLEKPELNEIKAGAGKNDNRDKEKDFKRGFEFSLSALLKRPQRQGEVGKDGRINAAAPVDGSKPAVKPASVSAAPVAIPATQAVAAAPAAKTN